MRVLGIDPGTATTGYGLVEVEGKGLTTEEFGLIETSKDGETAERLLKIERELLVLIKKLRPDIIAIEKIFFATNAKTAIAVGQAQGVMFLSAAKSKIPIAEYAPGSIKKVVAGDGRADKKMVQQAVRRHLGSHVRSKKHGRTHFDNAADALAVALCHIMKGGEGNGL